MKIEVTEEMQEALRWRKERAADYARRVPGALTDLRRAEARIARLVAEAVEREETK